MAPRPSRSWPPRGSRLSIASQDSVLSIGSRGSVLSIASVGSVGSVGSIGSGLSLLSVGSWMAVGSLLSAQSRWSVMSSQSRDSVLARRASGRPSRIPRVAVGTAAVLAVGAGVARWWAASVPRRGQPTGATGPTASR